MSNRPCIVFVGLLMVALATISVSNAEDDAPHGEGEAHSQHEFHRNHIAFFLGVTDGGDAEEGGEEKTAGTLGVDYERRLSRLIGIGFLADYAGGDRREAIAGIPVFFHAGRAAKFHVAPAIEWKTETDESDFAWRLGFAYDFEVGRATIAPALHVDLVEGEQVYVVGVDLGWGF
jgi:hypothetical protein